jgi:glycerophosphoryl diester phosphodiesterase
MHSNKNTNNKNILFIVFFTFIFLFQKKAENMLKSTSVTAFAPTNYHFNTNNNMLDRQILKTTVSCPSFQLDMIMNLNSKNMNINFDSNGPTSNTVRRRDGTSSNASLSTSSSVTSLASTIVSSDGDVALPGLINEEPVVVTKSQEECLKSLASTLEVDSHSILHRKDSTRPIVCGHRGVPYKSLENTRHGFQTAHALGCDEVELDVFLLKCGTLCVFHGHGTDQNPGLLSQYSTNMYGSILEYTYDDLKDKVIFNSDYEEFGCGPSIIKLLQDSDECYIPTLEQVLIDAKKSGITVKIELKGPGTVEPTLELVEKLDMVSQCHFSSFELSRIRRVRELRPQRHTFTNEHVYKTGALFDTVPSNFIEMALDVDASEVHLKYSSCTKSRVDDIHAAGMDSMCWFRGPVGMKDDVAFKYDDVGNEDEMMFRVVMATGVRKMCVNKADVLIQMFDSQYE